METSVLYPVHLYLFWIFLLAVIITGVVTFRKGNFVAVFRGESNEWLPIVAYLLFAIVIVGWDYSQNNQWPWYPIYFGLSGLLLHLFQISYIYDELYLIPSKDESKEKVSYESMFYFLFTVGSLLALIFWTANKITLYHWVLLLVPGVMLILDIAGLSIANFQWIKLRLKNYNK